MTVYRDDSEVSRLNARAHLGRSRSSPGLFRLLQQAVVLSRETGGGAYDVTSGALSEAWGFVKGPRRVPEARPWPMHGRGRAGNTSGWIPSVARSRSTAKGSGSTWGASARDTPSTGLSNCYGLTGGRRRPGPWGAIQPLRAGLAAGPVRRSLGDRAAQSIPAGIAPRRHPTARPGIGTSGSSFQQFVIDGRVFGHIIDPRSGRTGPGASQRDRPGPDRRPGRCPVRRPFTCSERTRPRHYIAQHPEIGAVIVEGSPERRKDDLSPRIRVLGLSEHDFVAKAATLSKIRTVRPTECPQWSLAFGRNPRRRTG